MSQEERVAFELWAVNHICEKSDLRQRRLTGYGSQELNYLWRGWTARAALESARQIELEPEIIGWATHHEPPMLFLTKAEASEYCDDDEKPIALVAKGSR